MARISPCRTFCPGDVLAFSGNDRVSRLIKFFTGPISAFGFLAVSHVAICVEFDDSRHTYPIADPQSPSGKRYVPLKRIDGTVLVESTTLCDEPCLVTGKPIAGVQVHRPEDRVARFDGRVYILRPSDKRPFSRREAHALAYGASRWIGEPYDLVGALFSALPHPLPTDDSRGFCSFLVAYLLMNVGRIERDNARGITPAALVRRLVRTGVYERWERIK